MASASGIRIELEKEGKGIETLERIPMQLYAKERKGKEKKDGAGKKDGRDFKKGEKEE